MKIGRKWAVLLGIIVLISLIIIVMENSRKNIWFEGTGNIQTSISNIENEFKMKGNYFEQIVKLMPSMLSVEIIDQGSDFLHIQTNEGVMKRSSIRSEKEPDEFMIEFDEHYKAGKTITTQSHFKHRFTASDGVVEHHLEISNVKASGIAGFFYRHFGSKNIGNAFLKAHKMHLEK